jgi:hypothetical protein
MVKRSMKFLFTCLVVFAGSPAMADFLLNPGETKTLSCDYVLRAGETQSLTCSRNGGGGGHGDEYRQCVTKLNDWCNANTSYDRDHCYRTVTAFCPTVRFATCVSETAQYCYDNTSMDMDHCFNSGLDSCRGNGRALIQLFQEFANGARLLEQGKSLKPAVNPNAASDSN